MEKMGDVINANIEKELMRKLEKDYIHDCINADQKAIAQDKRKKEQKKRQNLLNFDDLDR